jgi:ATP-dependent helicase/DNAse subunit B
VARLRDRLLDASLAACFAPRLMTFGHFAHWVLESAGQPATPLGAAMKRHLLRQLVEQQLAAGRLVHFAAIARSGGLVNLLVPWISELKRLEIWPEHLRQALAPTASPRDAELLGLYEAYQELLHRHGLFDFEGRAWAARTLLQEQGSRLLAALRLVVVDGFADFTRTEYEMLDALVQHAGEIYLTLPLEDEPCRGDLFGKSCDTLSELRRRFPGLQQQQLSRRGSNWPAIDHLESHLFQPPAQAQPAPQTDGLEILAAVGEVGQLQRIGVRIKRLLTEGDGPHRVRPQDIAVVFRSPPAAAPLVREVFGRLGIPFAIEAGHCLAAAPRMRRLLVLLRLEADDWPRRSLLSLLASQDFQLADSLSSAADRTIRRLQIPRGKKALFTAIQRQLDVLRQRRKTTAAGEPARAALVKEVRQTEQTQALFERLAGMLGALPQQETLTGWAAAWRQLAAEWGMFDQQAPGDSPEWSALEEALGAGDRLATQMGERPKRLTQSQALAVLADLIENTTLPERIDESGRVRILSAHSVRTLEFPYVFLAGLSEKSFPAPPSEGRLYGESQQRRLIERGLPLVSAVARAREEMLLFYEVLTRATRRLWLCYPAVDEAGQPLSASPFLQEVEQACGDTPIRRSESIDLTPLPPEEEPLSADALRIRAVADGLAGNIALLAGLVRQEPSPGLAENMLAGLAALEERSRRDRFGSLEGMLQGSAALNVLAARFAPDRVFSVTDLEAYAECPFRFLMERVLAIEPLAEAELRPDYLARGRRMHEILAALHVRLNAMQERYASPAELEPEQYEQLWQAVLNDLPDPAGGSVLDAALRAIDRRLIARWMADYRTQHERYDQLWSKEGPQLRPALFEVCFGQSQSPSGDVSKRAKPPRDYPLFPEDTAAARSQSPLVLHDGDRTIGLSGRVDRIDLGTVGENTVFNVLDYKTGSATQFSAESAARGLTLQLPLYAMAAEELLLPAERAPQAWQAGYWYVAGGGYAPRRALQMHRQVAGRVEPNPEWPALRQAVVQTVFALVRGLQQGQFPVYNPDPECTGQCPFRTVCRINQIRSLEKTWQPPTKAD